MRKIHTTAPCSSALRDLLRQSLAAAAHLLRLLLGSGAMQAAGIEPAPSRHEPGDSTTNTAPTTTHYMHTATDGTLHKYPDRPSGRCCCWRGKTGTNTNTAPTKPTTHGYARPLNPATPAPVQPMPIPLYQCVHVFLCVCGGVVAPSTRVLGAGCGKGSSRAPPRAVFVVCCSNSRIPIALDRVAASVGAREESVYPVLHCVCTDLCRTLRCSQQTERRLGQLCCS